MKRGRTRFPRDEPRTTAAVSNAMPRQRIALVSDDRPTRRALARYLTSAGFQVYECDELAGTASCSALVLLADLRATADALDALVCSWLALAKAQRIVVVTAKPHALTELLAMHAERLFVLAAPAFGWDLVDALRAAPALGPRRA